MTGRASATSGRCRPSHLAGLLQSLQTDYPTRPVISIGDYNAYQFNDGYTDPISVITGMPTPDDQIVVDESPDVVSPNFVNFTGSLAAEERYSFIFEGTPQALDHVLLNTVANSIARDYAIARNNADFPEGPLFENDATRPERNSDHDMPVAYFAFPPEADLAVTVTSPAGTVQTGASFSYSVMVANEGPEAAANVVLSIPANANLRFMSIAAAGGWSCTTPAPGVSGPVSCTIASLAEGASATFTVTAGLDCAVANGASIVQGVEVGSSAVDPDAGDNLADVTVAASNPPPTISGVIASITAPPLPGAARAGAVVSDATLGSPTASDNCPAPTVARTGVPAGNIFPVGDTTVIPTPPPIQAAPPRRPRRPCTCSARLNH